jgi:hypothetical protein
MGKLFKSAATLNILDPVMHHWGQGAFDSSRKGRRGKFKNLAGQGKNMTNQQKQEYLAREEAKSEVTTSPLSSRYS